MTATRLQRLEAARLYLIATVAGEPAAGPLERISAAVRGGVAMVQLRLVAHSGSALRRAWLAALRDGLPAETLLIVNDDLDAAGEADGVHLGREDAAAVGGLAAARERLGPHPLLGTSTRTLDEVRRAVAAGCDHVGFGALAASRTKSDTRAADPAELHRCVEAFPRLPIFAIGGLGPGNLHVVTAAGCRRAAVGAAILDTLDPEAAARACRGVLDMA